MQDCKSKPKLHAINFRITENELNQIRAASQKMNVSIQTYLKIRLFDYKLVQKQPVAGKYYPKHPFVLNAEEHQLNNSGSITPTGISPIATTSTFQPPLQPQHKQLSQSYPPITYDMSICAGSSITTLQSLGIDIKALKEAVESDIVVRSANNPEDEVITTSLWKTSGGENGLLIMTRSKWKQHQNEQSLQEEKEEELRRQQEDSPTDGQDSFSDNNSIDDDEIDYASFTDATPVVAKMDVSTTTNVDTLRLLGIDLSSFVGKGGVQIGDVVRSAKDPQNEVVLTDVEGSFGGYLFMDRGEYERYQIEEFC